MIFNCQLQHTLMIVTHISILHILSSYAAHKVRKRIASTGEGGQYIFFHNIKITILIFTQKKFPSFSFFLCNQTVCQRETVIQLLCLLFRPEKLPQRKVEMMENGKCCWDEKEKQGGEKLWSDRDGDYAVCVCVSETIFLFQPKSCY